MENIEFKSTEKKARVVTIFLYVGIAFGLSSLLVATATNLFFSEMGKSGTVSAGEIIFTLLIFVNLLLTLVTSLGTIISFLIWFNQSHNNLTALGVEPDSSSAWAIGSWFIPFVQLFEPYRITNDIYEKSELLGQDIYSDVKTSSGIVLMWWFFWVGSGIVSGVLVAVSGLNSDFAASMWVIPLNSLVVTLSIVSAILLIKIINRITQRQIEGSGSSRVFTPPDPPIFNQ